MPKQRLKMQWKIGNKVKIGDSVTLLRAWKNLQPLRKQLQILITQI